MPPIKTLLLLKLKLDPLYVILSSFTFGDTPDVGTFYDFLNRLWDSEKLLILKSLLVIEAL